MVAIEHIPDLPARPAQPSTHARALVLLALLGSAILALAALSFGAEIGTDWRFASETVSRFSLLFFVAAMAVEPLARLFPARALRQAASERPGLMLAFVAAAMLSLVLLVAPARLALDSEPLTVPTIAYALLTGAVLLVLLFSSHPATIRLLGAPAWRTFQRIATSYFWIMFVLTGIDRIVGPHLPDPWPGFSLMLLTVVLLLRFTDALVLHLRGFSRKAAAE